MIDRRQRLGGEKEPETEHARHAEPESQADDDRDVGDLPRRQRGARIDPITHRRAGEQRKAQREGKGVAGEGRQRDGPERRPGAGLAQRGDVIAGQRDIGEAGQTQRLQQRRAMRLGDRGGEIGESQMPQRAAYDDGGESEQARLAIAAIQPPTPRVGRGDCLDDGRKA